MRTDAPVIHIVDDDELFRTSVARLLRVSGYQVALYDLAHRLLQTPSAMTPGCILLDVRMPGVSGPELQARLVAAGNPLPIVFLTGHGDIPTSVKAIKAGAEDFLSKPVSRKTLVGHPARAGALRRDARTEPSAGRLARSRGQLDAAGKRGLCAGRARQAQQADRARARHVGAHIKAHRHAVMEKLKVQSLAEAVSIAKRLGLPRRQQSLELMTGRHACRTAPKNNIFHPVAV